MAAALLSVVVPTKFLGANYGFALVVPFMNSRIETLNLDVKNDFAFTDMYFQPLSLGWHRAQADFNAGYAVIIPAPLYGRSREDLQ